MREYSSVKSLNEEIKTTLILNPDLGSTFSVRGELSGCSYRGNNLFFKILDKPESGAVVDKSKLPSIAGSVWNYASYGISRDLKDGQAVVVKGKIDVWTNKGEYRINASSIALDGQGLREQQLAQLKAKLEAEGFFDPANKKPLPRFPKRVGIVTATTGKGLNDITHAAHAKNPYLRFVFQPVQVEGKGSAESVARGIQVLDAMGLDIIIVGRGGGSPESLWTFDEELVLRAIFNAKTPIISAVGHEDDYLLSDFVADVRANTPTYAGDMVAVDMYEIFRGLDEAREKYFRYIDNKLNTLRLLLNNSRTKLEGLSPVRKLDNQKKQLEIYTNNLNQSIDKLVLGKYNTLANHQVRLEASRPEKLLEKRKQEYDMLSKILSRNMLDKYQRTAEKFNYLVAKLNGLSPTAKLVNGFGYIAVEGEALTTAKAVSKGDSLKVTVSDGEINAVVEDVLIKDFN